MTRIPETQPYLDRRGLLMEQLDRGLILVRGAAGGEVNPNFFYLTGLTAPGALLLLAPGGVRIGTGRTNPGRDYMAGRIAQQVLFLPRRDAMAERWGEDESPAVGDIEAADLGLDAVYANDDRAAVLGAALRPASMLHYVRSGPASFGGAADPDSEFVERIARRFFHLTVRDGTPAVEEMRRIKDAGEIAAIERSIAVTAQALDRILEVVAPGMREYELEAEIARTYRAHGGTHAFDPIVACGANALKLHYRQNRSPVESGCLLLVDTGVSLGGYSSDITRTVPVDGRFDRRQREVYEVVLAARDAAVERCRPGALLSDLHAAAFDVISAAGLGEGFPHGVGHHLGLLTHDAGDVHRSLEPGCVVTIEPGVYLAQERLGIRIEDDVLVTPDGCRVLSEAIPRTVEALERRMASRAGR